MEEDQAYQYQPLPEPHYIRLLKLLPGPPDAPIAVALHDCSLDSAPAFDAVSYVWGDPTAREEIACGDGRLSITRSLHDALTRFRREDEARLLWADAICINQGDLAERAQQVQIMDWVYRSARVCLIWLGPADEESDIAMQLISGISAEVCRLKGLAHEDLDSEFDKNGRDMFQGARVGFNNLPPPNSPQWFCLSKFFKRKWFSRIWVLQEAHFAAVAEVYCGAAQTTFAPVHHAADWLLTNSSNLDLDVFWFPWVRDKAFQDANYVSEDNYANVTIMRGNYLNNPQQPLSLASLLSYGQRFDATDARDKVYAMMHFDVFRRELPDLRVDYTQPFDALYTDVAFAILQRSQSLKLLSFANRGPDDDGLLPSWVPRWHKGNPRSMGSILFSHEDPLFFADASQPLACIKRLPPDGRGIRLRGITLASVADICDLVAWHLDTKDPLRKPTFSPHAPWAPYDVAAPGRAYPSKEALITAYALTLTSGGIEHQGTFALRCSETRVAGQRVECVSWLQHLREDVGEGEEPVVPPGLYADTQPRVVDVEEAAYREMWVRFQGMVRMFAAKRCLFRTDGRQWLGLGVSGVKEGDRVVLLRGGAAAFVLRRREEGGGYVLVGDAYVHGVMDGEGWVGREEGDEEWFDVF